MADTAIQLAPWRGTTSNERILNLDMSEHSVDKIAAESLGPGRPDGGFVILHTPVFFGLIYCIYIYIWYVYIANIYIYIWYDMIWYDMIWYDMIWYDMIWYDMIWFVETTLKTIYANIYKQGICWWSELNPRNMLEEISDGAQGLWLKEFWQSSGLKGTKELLVSMFPIFPY